MTPVFNPGHSVHRVTHAFSFCRSTRGALIAAGSAVLIGLSPVSAHAACPPLPRIAPEADFAHWQTVRKTLARQFNQCLRSPDFFALYGASLLNTGYLDNAKEMLERALLLEPENGSALVDYSEALYRSGELMAALQLNRQLLERTDLPDRLRPYLQQRQSYWERLAVVWQHRLVLETGYDSNLSGVADLDTLTLTVDGQDFVYDVADSSQPVSGGFFKTQWNSIREKTGIGYTDYLQFYLRSRNSEYRFTDIVEASLSYKRRQEMAFGELDLSAGAAYLYYGGEPLYASVNTRLRYRWQSDRCKPYVVAELEQTFFDSSNRQNDISLELAGGVRCRSGELSTTVENRFMASQSSHSDRPGGDRQGHQLSLRLQYSLGRGLAQSEFSYLRMNDDKAYSPVLANGAARNIRRSGVVTQYLYPLSSGLTFMAAHTWQQQRSNLSLFRTQSSAFSLGLAFSF